MIGARSHAAVVPSFPRFFRIGRYWVSAYKVFLCVSIYSGILVSAAVADRSGISPLRLGIGLLACAILALIGARAYHLAVNFAAYCRVGLSPWSRRARTKTDGVCSAA